MNQEREHFADNFYVSGHTACAGCGQSMAVRIVMNAAGKNTMVANSTGCLEVFSTKAPETAFGVPWVHSLFENSAAVASGIEAALTQTGQLPNIRVISQAGDGGTGDIGLQAISGMLERGHDVLFVCYDNEAYMNTGIQRSGSTPFNAHTTTSPAGKCSTGNPKPKKPMVEICAAHHIPYSATATVGNAKDIERKVKKALSIRGPKYLQIHVPCPLGWKSNSGLTIEIAKLAYQSGLYPLVEYENGKLTNVTKIGKQVPVEEYLKLQGRFKHVIKNKEALEAVQKVADNNIEYYGLKA
jgi:pyruvate ferredoxin oxidoreductase beta subunit